MGFLDNLLCKDTLERNAILEKENQKLLIEIAELRASNVSLSSHVESIDIYKITEEQYRSATMNIELRLKQEDNEFQKYVRDYEDSRAKMGEVIVRLEKKVEDRTAEYNAIKDVIIKSNAIINVNKTEENKLSESISKLTAQYDSLNKNISISAETEAKCKKEEKILNATLDTLRKQKSQAELATQAINKSLGHLKRNHDNEIVFDLLGIDCNAGYVSEWAPQLFKRLYRHDKDRAKRLFLELWSRHPEPSKFVFSDDSLKLTVDGKPIEELFAAIVAERTGQSKDNPEPFIRAWENFINASNN